MADQSNVLNDRTQGGANWNIGGTLTILSTGKIVPSTGSIPTLSTDEITDDTGGAPSTTFAAITAGSSYAQADMVAVKNALSQTAATLNAIIAALIAINVAD